MDYDIARWFRQGAPLAATLAVLGLILAISALLSLGREIFVPVALALLLSFVLAPGVRALQRLRVPHGLAVVAVVLLFFSVFLGVGAIVVNQLSGLVGEVPKYRVTISEKIGRIAGPAGEDGPFGRAMEAIQSLQKEIASGGRSDTAGAEGATARRPMPVVVQEESGLVSIAGTVVSPILHPLATTGLVLIFLVFVLAQREDLRNRLIRLLGTEDLQHTTAVFDDLGRRLSKFFLTQLILNASFGVLVALGLWAIGTPTPLLWGILAAISRYIPYVGVVIGASIPLALAVAVDPGWTMLIWTVALFLVLEPVYGHVLEPVLFGHTTGLSPVAVMLAATVWAFLWGPIGLILATPLTVCLVVLGRHVSQLEFVDIILGDRPALSPGEIFYQRMLAGDPTEATLQAREFLRERALATYYDEVALQGLRLAHRDIGRGRISPERQGVLLDSVRTLIANLDSVRDAVPRGGVVGSEAAAAVVAAGPDRAASLIVAGPEDLRPDWRGPFPVVCVAQKGTVDEVVAAMVAQVLTKQGLKTRVVGADEVAGMSPAGQDGARLACLSYLSPLSTVHLRYAVRQARRHLGASSVILGMWRDRDPSAGQSLRMAARADVLATTIFATLAAAQEAAGVGATLRRNLAASAPSVSPNLVPTAT